MWARADTRRTQAPGRDGSRSDRTAGASYGLCDPGSVGHRGKCAERPGDPLPLEPCSSVPQHWAPAPPWAAEPCPAVAGKLGGKWTQCAVPLCTHACPCAHTRASVGFGGPAAPAPSSGWFSAGGLARVFRASLVGWCERLSLPPPACSLAAAGPPPLLRQVPAVVPFVPLSSKTRRRAGGGLKASPWHRAERVLTGRAVLPGVGAEAGVLPKPAWVREGPKAASGSRLSGGVRQGLGMGGSHPARWPCGQAGVDEVWASGWSRGHWSSE